MPHRQPPPQAARDEQEPRDQKSTWLFGKDDNRRPKPGCGQQVWASTQNLSPATESAEKLGKAGLCFESELSTAGQTPQSPRWVPSPKTDAAATPPNPRTGVGAAPAMRSFGGSLTRLLPLDLPLPPAEAAARPELRQHRRRRAGRERR